MANSFLSDDFFLDNPTAQILYFEHAAKMPVYDYHSHLPAKDIAADRQFRNLSEIWLSGDHYKWRLMRAHGVDERFITGDAPDFEKFQKWAQTLPFCIANPIYHWTHLELQRFFGIENICCSDTVQDIYQSANQMLQSKDFSVKNLLRKANVKLVCTTEDPLDSLEHHRALKKDGFEISVHTTFRPDKAMNLDSLPELNRWIDSLRQITNIDVKDFQSYIEAIRIRHSLFHQNECRLSDHGLDKVYAEDYTLKEIEKIFSSVIAEKEITSLQKDKFKSAMLYEFALMDYQSNWAQQFHIGALRNINTKMFAALGPDSGYDSIADFPVAQPLAKFLDRLAHGNNLAKTIIYTLNPADYEPIASLIGGFQDGSFPCKIQLGPAWWFLDTKDGIEKQLMTLANFSILSHFVGMLTDSRSFLSFVRHEYFRRILCNFIGSEVESGLLPNDISLLGQIVRNICYNNARNYFDMSCCD